MSYDQRAMYVMSVAAELAGLSPQTLRGYERKGLIEPARSLGGSRLYSEADLARLRRISQLTGAGLNLAGVRAVLDLEDHLASLQAELDDERERSHADTAKLEPGSRPDLVPFRREPAISQPTLHAGAPPAAIRVDPIRVGGSDAPPAETSWEMDTLSEPHAKDPSRRVPSTDARAPRLGR